VNASEVVIRAAIAGRRDAPLYGRDGRGETGRYNWIARSRANRKRNLRLVLRGSAVTLKPSFQGLSAFVTLRIFG
jgi:hypothetical protein